MQKIFSDTNIIDTPIENNPVNDTPINDTPINDTSSSNDSFNRVPPIGSVPGRVNRNRLEELVSLGYGESSFTIPNSPYRSRINGITATVQASQENRVLQKNFDLKNKKCLKCQKNS